MKTETTIQSSAVQLETTVTAASTPRDLSPAGLSVKSAIRAGGLKQMNHNRSIVRSSLQLKSVVKK